MHEATCAGRAGGRFGPPLGPIQQCGPAPQGVSVTFANGCEPARGCISMSDRRLMGMEGRCGDLPMAEAGRGGATRDEEGPWEWARGHLPFWVFLFVAS